MIRLRIILFISTLILASVHAQTETGDPATTEATSTNNPTTTGNPETTDNPTTTGQPRPPSPIACSYANNTLGKCGCNGQLWIAHQCHSGFFCLVEDGQVVPNTQYQGCEIECAEDEILVVDPHNGGSWSCHKTNENTRPLICPGRFNTECACTDEPTTEEPDICKMGECACDTQVWVAHDCTEAKICGPDEHVVQCNNNATPYINVNLITHEWFCSADGDNCLGSFHVGCRKDLMDPTTMDPTTMDPTTMDPDDSGAGNLFSSALALALPVFVAYLASAIMI
jgi:hypothetical protein